MILISGTLFYSNVKIWDWDYGTKPRTNVLDGNSTDYIQDTFLLFIFKGRWQIIEEAMSQIDLINIILWDFSSLESRT